MDNFDYVKLDWLNYKITKKWIFIQRDMKIEFEE